MCARITYEHPLVQFPPGVNDDTRIGRASIEGFVGRRSTGLGYRQDRPSIEELARVPQACARHPLSDFRRAGLAGPDRSAEPGS